MQVSDVAALSDIGLRMSQNEDAILELPDVPLFAVADGMGGTRAAAATLDVLRRYAPKLKEHAERITKRGDSGSRLAIGRYFEAVFNKAGAAIRDGAAAAHSGREACTVVAATIIGNTAYIAHVGNSRAYLLRGGDARCLTADHTLAMRQFKQGLLTAADVATSPYRKTLTQTLGAAPQVHPDIAEVQLSPGDRLLLCSDGLMRGLDDAGIGRSAKRHEDGQALAQALIQAANKAGGRDNTSVVVIALKRPRPIGGTRPTRIELGVDVASALENVFLFKALSDAERLLIAPYLEQKHFRRSEIICREGDPGDTFFVLASGGASVTHGRTTLTELGPGDYAGEISLARVGTRTATITATADTHLLILSRARFLELMRRRPMLGIRLAMPLIDNVGSRIVDLRRRLEVIGGVMRGQ